VELQPASILSLLFCFWWKCLIPISLIANVIAFCIAFCVSFTGQRLFTFSNSNKTIKQSFLPYLLVSITSFFCNEILLTIGIYILKIPYQIALILVLVIIVAIGNVFQQ
jgi:putative flippase GtrA